MRGRNSQVTGTKITSVEIALQHYGRGTRNANVDAASAAAVVVVVTTMMNDGAR